MARGLGLQVVGRERLPAAEIPSQRLLLQWTHRRVDALDTCPPSRPGGGHADAGLRHGQPTHEPGEVAVADGPDDKVKVVVHDARREQPHFMPRYRLVLDPLESREVIVVVENGESGAGNVQNMIDQAAFGGAGIGS